MIQGRGKMEYATGYVADFKNIHAIVLFQYLLLCSSN